MIKLFKQINFYTIFSIKILVYLYRIVIYTGLYK